MLRTKGNGNWKGKTRGSKMSRNQNPGGSCVFVFLIFFFWGMCFHIGFCEFYVCNRECSLRVKFNLISENTVNYLWLAPLEK